MNREIAALFVVVLAAVVAEANPAGINLMLSGIKNLIMYGAIGYFNLLIT